MPYVTARVPILANAQYLQAKDSGGSAINLVGVNSSNVVEIGASGKVLNLIGSSVGVGIAAPAAGVSLHIHQPTTGSSAYLLLTNTTTGTSDGLYIGASGGSLDAIINNAANGGIAFGTNNTIVMKLDNTGKLGIGITSSMLAVLHVKGAASQLCIESTGADAQIRFKNTSTSDTYIDAAGTVMGFFINNSGTTALTLRDGSPSWSKSTYVSAWPASNQAVAATTFTILAFDTEGEDRLNEFDTTNHGFTPTVAGDYVYEVTIGQTGLAGNRFILTIGTAAGSETFRAYDGTQWLGTEFTYCFTIRLAAGTTYYLQVWADAAFTVYSIGNFNTRVVIAKAMT